MKAEHDKNHATKDGHGNITANDQNGVDVKGRPRKSDNKDWRFGDSLVDVKPTKHKKRTPPSLDAYNNAMRAVKKLKTLTPKQMEARLTAFELDEKS